MRLAERFGRVLNDKAVKFNGTERDDALLSNTSRMQTAFTAPAVSVDEMIVRVADWISHDGSLLGKPTKFEARDGKF